MTPGPDGGRVGALVRGLTALVGLLLAAGIVVGALAPGAAGPGGAGGAGDAAVEQVDPAAAGEAGDVGALERRLADQISQRVRSGALNLSSGQIDRARSAIEDSRYERLLDDYEDLSSQTGNDAEARSLLELQRAQQRYTAAVSAYWDRHGTYENVSANETATDRTRAIARAMERRWLEIQANATTLIERYENASEVTGTDYGEAIDAVRETTANVSETQAGVRRVEFVQTEYRDLDVSTGPISFTDPLVVSGRVETADGDPLRDTNLTFAAGNRTINASTDAAGGFEVAYRPVDLPLNASSVTVGYRPPNGSIYLGDETTVNVTVERVTPTVTVDTAADTTQYGQNLTVTGRVAADAVGVPEAPYLLTVGDRLVAINETDGDGTFEREVSLPAEVGPGPVPVRASLTLEGRAIGNASGETTVEVREVDPRLSIEASPEPDRKVRIAGRLDLADGTNVTEQRVALLVDDTYLASAETGTTGRFESVVVVPGRLLDGDNATTVDVTANFDGNGTSLRSTNASASVTLQGGDGLGWLLPAAVVGGLVAAGLVVAWLRPWRVLRGRRRGGATGPADDPFVGAARDTDAGDEGRRIESLLSTARDQVGRGDPAAGVQLAYAAMRAGLSPAVENADGRTHWEFLRACRGADLDERTTETLARATALYEEVTFAAGSVSETAAREVLDSVEALARGQAGAGDGAGGKADTEGGPGDPVPDGGTEGPGSAGGESGDDGDGDGDGYGHGDRDREKSP